MSSVTRRIKEIKQPRGGYLTPKQFNVYEYNDGIVLNENENIHTSIVGLCVDYLTRFMLGNTVEDAFRISLKGALQLDMINGKKQNIYKAKSLADSIKGLDDESIASACQLCGYDVVFRAGVAGYKPVETILPDEDTISNIRIMVNRSLNFIKDYGPIILDGFTFEGGYTETVDAGDGDFLTNDTLWDFKVSKSEIKNQHTLQILMYYLMGIHSIHEVFQDIKKLGIYNPRLNKVYTLEISTIPEEIINEVGDYVIGYNTSNYEEKIVDDSDQNQILKLKDLAQRYGVSTTKITKSFIPLGLPYTKKGNAYQFDFNEVRKWEAVQRAVPFGKNNYIVLPAYYDVLDEFEKALQEAKQSNDQEQVKAIKKKLKEYRLDSKNSNSIVIVLSIVLFAIIIAIFLITR